MTNHLTHSKASLVGLLFVALVVSPLTASAHPGHGRHHEKVFGFVDGLHHPLTGLDHCIAMIAIGAWAAQLGGRALVFIPFAFLGAMTIGGLLARVVTSVAYLDQSLAVSVLVIGLLIGSAAKLPLVASLTIAGLFAVFHGYAHAIEIPRSATLLGYGSGILVSSALLMGIGLAAAQLMIRAGHKSVVRWGGAAISLCSLLLCIR